MSRLVSVVAAMAVVASFSGCGLLPFGGSGVPKPTQCYSNQYPGDLADAKVGRSVTYASEAGGQKTLMTTKIVGKDGDAWWVESWMENPSFAMGHLFKIGSDKKITEAYVAGKDEKEWTKIKVEEPPKMDASAAGQKPVVKESNEKKEVKAGTFDCKKLDITMNIQGKDYTTTSWYSKDVWKIAMPSEHGGAVAMDVAGSKTSLEAKADDAKPTIELPAKK